MKIMTLDWPAKLAVAAILLCSMAFGPQAQAAPKKVLVVTTTLGFRHSSIPTAERIIAKLGNESGLFTVDYARVNPDDPQYKADTKQEHEAKVHEAIKSVLAEKMSLEALKNYDAVIFANTTGDLPLPDRDGFIDWVKSGKGFVGMHAAGDTFHGFPGYLEMLGAEFKHHDAQVEIEPIINDDKCPACSFIPKGWKVFDEIYQFQKFDRSKVHGLLSLDHHPNHMDIPGDYPVSWCKQIGAGRLFYTSLGHREDVWDPDWKDRKNPKEVAEIYQKHILEGIKWALGLETWDAKPQKSE